MDYFDELAAGLHPLAPPNRATRKAPPSMEQELQLSYALAKKVPEMMQRGFTIETSYGEIVIEPGRHADAIAATVRRALEIQLKAAALARRDAEMDGRYA